MASGPSPNMYDHTITRNQSNGVFSCIESSSWRRGSRSTPTFLFGGTGQRVLVFVLPCDPAVLHTTEEGSPSSAGQKGRPEGGLRLGLDPSCAKKDARDSRCSCEFAAWTNFFLEVLLEASVRRWWGSISEDESCSFTLLISLGWMKSNKLCPVSSNWK